VRHEARAGAAALAVVEEDGAGGAGNRRFDIGIAEDDRRRLAAQFQRYLLQIAGGGLDDELADLGRSGEGDLVDPFMRGQRGAAPTAALSS